MSDSSGDELANYNPTTPARFSSSTSKPSDAGGSRSVAGTSKPAAAEKATKSNGSKQRNVRDQIVIGSSSDEDTPAAQGNDKQPTGAVVPTTKNNTKRGPGRPANGKTKASLTKGKAPADPPKPGRHGRDVMVLEEEMNVDGDDAVESIPSVKKPAVTSQVDAKSSKNASWHQSKEREKLLRVLEDLRRQLESVTSERDKYSQQLEELFQIRHTEPERALEEQSIQYEARIKTQEAMITELTTQLTKIKALGGSEKSYTLHFLTREAADEEKEAVKQEVGRWRDTVKEKDEQLAEKEERIVQLQNVEKTLRSDLAAEIERGKVLASRNPPPSVSRVPGKPSDDPKTGLVISLYEELTNFLVLSVKVEKSEYLHLDEPVYTCVYTSDPSDEKRASLNFSLRDYWDKASPDAPVHSKDDLIQKVKYQPRDLHNEPPAFVEALDFFKDTFVFSRDQLSVFLKSIATRMAEGVNKLGEENKPDADEYDQTKDIIELD